MRMKRTMKLMRQSMSKTRNPNRMNDGHERQTDNDKADHEIAKNTNRKKRDVAKRKNDADDSDDGVDDELGDDEEDEKEGKRQIMKRLVAMLRGKDHEQQQALDSTVMTRRMTLMPRTKTRRPRRKRYSMGENHEQVRILRSMTMMRMR